MTGALYTKRDIKIPPGASVEYFPPRGLPRFIAQYYKDTFNRRNGKGFLLKNRLRGLDAPTTLWSVHSSIRNISKVESDSLIPAISLTFGANPNAIFAKLSPEHQGLFLAALGISLKTECPANIARELSVRPERLASVLPRRPIGANNAISRLLAFGINDLDTGYCQARIQAAVYILSVSERFTLRSYFLALGHLAKRVRHPNTYVHECAKKSLEALVSTLYTKSAPFPNFHQRATQQLQEAATHLKIPGVWDTILQVIEVAEHQPSARMKLCIDLLEELTQISSRSQSFRLLGTNLGHAKAQFKYALRKGSDELVANSFVAAFAISPKYACRLLARRAVKFDGSLLSEVARNLLITTYYELLPLKENTPTALANLASIGLNRMQLNQLLRVSEKLCPRLSYLQKMPSLIGKWFLPTIPDREPLIAVRGELRRDHTAELVA